MEESRVQFPNPTQLFDNVTFITFSVSVFPESKNNNNKKKYAFT